MSGGEIIAATTNNVGTPFSASDLEASVASFLKAWGEPGYHPPVFAAAGERYLSLADLFYLLASSLAHRDRTGSPPSPVILRNIYGPLDVTLQAGTAGGKVTIKGILAASRGIADAWSPQGAIFVPGWVDVEGQHLNSAQFLRLMSKAFLSGTSDGSLDVHFPRRCAQKSAKDFRLRFAQPRWVRAWTVKPAPLKLTPE